MYEDVRDSFTYILREAGIKGSGYLCKFCINKLNIITRIDGKKSTINVERRQILADLSKRFSKDHDEGKLTTPIKSKRPLAKIMHSSRKTKTIRLLPFPESSSEQSSRLQSEPNVQEFDVKVCIIV